MLHDDVRKKYFSPAFQIFNGLLIDLFKNNSCGIVLDLDGEHWPVGSGTFVRYQNRILVSTAAHLFKDDEHREVWVGTTDSRFFPARKVFSIGGNAGNSFDMACLEIENCLETRDIFEKAYDYEKISEDLTPILDKDVAFLCGFPWDTYSREARRIVFMPYQTNFKVYSGWGEGADPNLHLYLSYNPLGLDQQLESLAMPDVNGYSGGGIWLLRGNPDAVISLEDAHLVGIEDSWWKQPQEVRGMKMKPWKDQVRAIYS